MTAELGLAFCFLIIGSLGGIVISKKYDQRVIFYSCLKQFNIDFLNELTFSKKNIEQILSNNYGFSPFSELLNAKKNQLHFQKKYSYNIPNWINDSESKEIIYYFNSLGKCDCETQKNSLMRYEKIFDEKLCAVKEEKTKYGMLIKKTGVIVGLIAFILMV